MVKRYIPYTITMIKGRCASTPSDSMSFSYSFTTTTSTSERSDDLSDESTMNERTTGSSLIFNGPVTITNSIVTINQKVNSDPKTVTEHTYCENVDPITCEKICSCLGSTIECLCNGLAFVVLIIIKPFRKFNWRKCKHCFTLNFVVEEDKIYIPVPVPNFLYNLCLKTTFLYVVSSKLLIILQKISQYNFLDPQVGVIQS